MECKKERILVVDDEPALVDIAREFLETLGYQVVTKTDSVEAFELFQQQPDSFDLVITDQSMPVMNGDMLTAKIKKIRQSIPVVLSTGHSEYASTDRQRELNVQGVILKPFAARTLKMAIRCALAK
ncbi:MAG: response regulator [bacterium]|nr:response regulator [bacterium]